METPAAKLFVLVEKDWACVKIVGRANFNSSLDFKTLVVELRARGFNCFVIDLSECLLMDSTFLGVLAGCALKMQEEADAGRGKKLQLLNPNPRIAELLENLGMMQLFSLCNEVVAKSDGMTPQVSQAPASREEVTRTCLDAHKLLMELHPDNVARFKDVARFLADDLQKLQTSR